jgi:uncharacterized protein YggE
MITAAKTFAAALLLATAPLGLAHADPASDAAFKATTLNLSADGEVRVAPDMATITLGVTTQGPTAGQAMQANAAQMTGVVQALRRQGVPERDIRTSSLNLNPQYQYGDNQPPRLTGYQASNQVTIRVEDLTKLGADLDAVVGAGANEIQGVSFGLKNSDAAEDQARVLAAKALAAKADVYANATGYRVVRLVNLSEAGGYAAPPPMPMMAMRAMDKVSTPIAAGDISVRVQVTGLYELGR